MNATAKYFVAGLVAVALGFVLLQALTDDEPGRARNGQLVGDDGEGAREGPGGRLAADGTGLRGGGSRPPGLEPGAAGAVPPRLRTPEGVDFSDPAVRRDHLADLLGAQPIDWNQVAALLEIMSEPIPPELRHFFLTELRTGRRNMVMLAFARLNDPSFTQDLFDLLDDPEAARGARAAALQALWKMPGGDAADIVLRLEGRLGNDLGQDREVLYAIARRGGREAARALVEYTQRSERPGDVPPYLLRQLDVTSDPEVARIVADAILGTQEPNVLKALLAVAGQPGASTFTRPLMGLDADGQDPALRQQIYQALGQIGDEEAVGHLLAKAREEGAVGEEALRAVGAVRSATPAARAALTAALASAAQSRHAELATENLLLALGALKHEQAIPAIVERLEASSPRVKAASVRALGRMGRGARTHVGKLVSTWPGADEGLRMNVAVALGSIGGEASIQAMEGFLRTEKLSPSLDKTLRMGVRAARDDLDQGR